MTQIKLVNVSNYILKKVNLQFKEDEFNIVLGPSGAGKTTLLKVIAGITNYEGHVYFDERCVDNIPPGKRNIGYVPQNLALFSHMTVWDNVAFGLKVRKENKETIRRKVSRVLKLLNIYHLKDHYPLKLSGGEKQRVAIARALAIDPEVLLLDEPFSNLHISLRIELLSKITSISKENGINVVIATHNIDFIETLHGKVAVLNKGRIIYDGSFKELLLRKEILNILPLISLPIDHVEPLANGLCLVKTGKISIVAPWERDVDDAKSVIIPSDKVVISNKPQRVQTNTYLALIKGINIINGWVNMALNIEGMDIKVSIPQNIVRDVNLKEKTKVYVKFPIRYVRIV
mgnify:CR=1 FL=1